MIVLGVCCKTLEPSGKHIRTPIGSMGKDSSFPPGQSEGFVYDTTDTPTQTTLTIFAGPLNVVKS